MPDRMDDAQALGQEHLKFLGEPSMAIAQPQTLMRDTVFEEDLAGEVSENGNGG